MKNWNLALVFGTAVITTTIGLGMNPASAYPPVTNGQNTGYFTIDGTASYYSGGTNTTTTQLNLNFFATLGTNGQYTLDTTKTNTLSWSQISTTATAIVGQPGNPSDYDGWSTKNVPISNMTFDSTTGAIKSIVFNTSDFELLSQYQQFKPPGKFSGDFLFVSGDPAFNGQWAQNQFGGTINIPVPSAPAPKDVINLNYKGNKGKGSSSSATYTITSISNFNTGTTPGITPNPSDDIFGTPFISVPEPTSILSLLALGTLGAASTLKRQLKSSKSSEKETTKVS